MIKLCPKTGRPIHPSRTPRWAKWLFPILGIGSLAWFLIRTLPKPSRAAYPCQRLAAPLASGFVIWLAGAAGAMGAYHKFRTLLREARFALAGLALAAGLVAAYVAVVNTPQPEAQAAYKTPDPVCKPIGEAKGLFPGRVVWVYDPTATNWDGTSGRWDDASHTNQTSVDQMMSKGIRWLTGRQTDAAAWDALFHDFNNTHGRGDAGYKAGQKIAIKINFVTQGVIDASGNQTTNLTSVAPSRQMLLSLLRQLVNVVGVSQDAITLGDPLQPFTNAYYDFLRAEFPNVKFLTAASTSLPGRTQSQFSSVPIKWSTAAANGKTQDYLPKAYAEADYFINFPILKAHVPAISLCGKNHYGSFMRTPDAAGYYNLHDSIATDGTATAGMGQYRAMVDILGHPQIGGKTLLCIVDGLWSGYYYNGAPQKWRMAPFNNNWPASLMMSQDVIAMDSVGYDLWYAEDEASWNYLPFNRPNYLHFPHVNGGDDYLHEAAQANNPPSGAFYDPGNTGHRLASLGVHEHWKSASVRKYSRNLGMGTGIELVTSEPSPIRGRYVFYNNSSFDGNDQAANAADDGAIAPDKIALLPGGTASFINYTSYGRGINGIMVDIANLPAGTPTAADFTFKVGNDSAPSAWAAAPAPTGITVRRGAGAYGSDRVTIIWADSAIQKQWLQVTVLANSHTGLTAADVFYWGNAIGDTGNSTTDAQVTPADEIVVRNSPHTLQQNPAPITDVCDFNRDGKVGPTDEIIVRNNATNASTALKLIVAP